MVPACALHEKRHYESSGSARASKLLGVTEGTEAVNTTTEEKHRKL